MAKKHFADRHGMTREDYEHAIQTATRTTKTSAADLTHAERNMLLTHFKAMGFEVIPRGGAKRLDAPQHKKLRALWYALADVGAVERPETAASCDSAVEAWAKRQSHGKVGPIERLRFADSGQLHKLIEELKAWGKRVGAQVE
ncbi:regulatory protein GemA [Variovorax sp. DAIF25]|uniref:regulatory protein GemA n=1 Tax=Variovorax sp. DAIF25 TaxID=3080983 RepID=UPI003D6ABB14